MNRYSSARALVVIISVLGWAAIAFAVYGTLAALERLGFAPALTIGLPMALGGLILIAVGQMIAAQLDTAENTAKMLAAIEKINSRLAPRQKPRTITPPPPRRNPEEPAVGDAVATHKGKTIVREAVGFSVDGNAFGSIPAAKVWIEAEALRPGSRAGQ